MNAINRKKLESAGWKVGSASDFLELSEAEETVVAMKLSLASKLKNLRREQGLTQVQMAKRIGSSQSRVAKMEIADKSVSMELYVRSLVSIGATREQIGKVIGRSGAKRKRPLAKKRNTKDRQPA